MRDEASGFVSFVVRATLFSAGRTLAIAVANWAPRTARAALTLDWAKMRALGLVTGGGGDPADARLVAPRIDGFQPAGSWRVGEELTLQAKRRGQNEGWLLQIVV